MFHRVRTTKVLIVLALCFLGSCVAAWAINISVSPAGQMQTIQSGAVTVTFISGLPAGYTLHCPDHNPDCGIIPGGKWVFPTGDMNPYLGTGVTPDFVSINLASVQKSLGISGPINYFGLYWGSIDTYNTISFWDNGTEVASFTGSQVAAAASSPVHFGTTSLFVNFYADSSTWTTIELMSSSPNFESDFHAFAHTAVPEPATLALVGLGLLGLGVALRKRDKGSLRR